MTTQTNLTKLRKNELISMVEELRAENAKLRAQHDALCVEVSDLMDINQELSSEIVDLRAEPQPQPQPAQPARRAPRDLSALRAAAMHYRTTSKFDEHGNVLVLVNGAWILA